MKYRPKPFGGQELSQRGPSRVTEPARNLCADTTDGQTEAFAPALRFTYGDVTQEAGPGDFVAWDGRIPHDGETVGDEPAEGLIITARG